MSNEVECVLDACVAEPTQLEIDTDCFRAWTQGVAVSELLSSLKSALLEQYELDASASGSGYSAIVQAQAAAAAQQLAAEEEERGAWSDEEEDAAPKLRHPHSLPTPAASARGRGPAAAEDEDDVDRAVTEQLRRAQAADAAEAGSSSDEDRARIRRKLGNNASRRNSATASVSGKQQQATQSRAQQKGSTTAAARSTPSAVPRSSGFSGATASASPSPLPVDLLGELPPPLIASIAASSLPTVPPEPSAIDLDSSSQAMSRLLWSWESQLDHQFRLFSLLEHALKKPFLLSVHYSVLQLSFQMQLQLTNLYYDFDRSFMRQLVGLKLSTKTRGNISDLQTKIKMERGADNQQEGREEGKRMDAAAAADAAQRSGLNALIPSSAELHFDLSSTLAAVSSADEPSSQPLSSPAGVSGGGDPVRFSSCCRQFDNLRRIYRARWGEKGDGEMDLRLDDFDAGISLLHSSIRAQAVSASMPGGTAAAGKKDDVLSERWRAMRAAAAAAMAKRGFGSDKNATAATPASATAASGAASSSATAAAAAANMRAQQWMLRHFDAGSSGSLLSGGVALGGGLDDFFGLDRSSLAMRPGEQTLPVFIQQQFRLHSSLACLYSRLIFLAHYRIGVSIIVKRKKKHLTMLSFDEVQLIAQILMRCWCVPVGSASAGAAGADDVAPQLDDPRAFSTSPAGSSSIVSLTTPGGAGAAGAAGSDPPTLSRLGTAESATAALGGRRGSLDDPSTAIYDLSPNTVPPSTRGPQSVSNFPSPALPLDGSAVPAAAPAPRVPASSGAACAGYDFLPIVSAMSPTDEECWVGDVLDSDFLSGLAELKTSMGSNRFMDEYAATLGRMMRDTIQLQLQITQQQLKAGTASAAPLTTAQSAAAAGAGSAAAAAASGSDSAGHSATSATLAVGGGSTLRSAVLLKLQSRLPALLKSLHSLAVNLPKSKRLRTLLNDLLEEVLRPILKLGASPHELMYFMRAVREAVILMPSVAHLHIEREAVYPHAYERRERAERAAAAAAAAAEQPTPSQQSRSIAAATVASAGSQTPAGSSAAAYARASQDPMRRALVRWCRFLDAIGPCSVILYINLSHSQEGQ